MPPAPMDGAGHRGPGPRQNPQPDAAFEALAQARLDLIEGPQWDAYFAAMAPWLHSPDPCHRARAVERLSMAALHAEPGQAQRVRPAGIAFAREPRLGWLLDTLERAHAVHDDVIPAFLSELRFQGQAGPGLAPLRAWLRRMLAAPPPRVRADVVRGTILLVDGHDNEDPACTERRVALLDDPSDYVRACAARSLSGIDSPHLGAAAAFALIGEKELRRPGIAGAFWSEWSFMQEHAPIDPVEWMMRLLEDRDGPEPPGLPFNDIVFHLHELCSHSPAMIRRMMAGGHLDLAIETATETHGVVEGLEPVLRDLAGHAEPEIARRARVHLARYYQA